MESRVLEHAVAAAISIAQELYDEPQWCRWAARWLDGIDRTTASAEAAYDAADEAMQSATCEDASIAAFAAALASQLAVDLSEARRWRELGEVNIAATLELSAMVIADVARQTVTRPH